MASEYAAHSRSRGNDTSAETYGEPQTPAELPKSNTGLVPAKRHARTTKGRSLERTSRRLQRFTFKITTATQSLSLRDNSRAVQQPTIRLSRKGCLDGGSPRERKSCSRQ